MQNYRELDTDTCHLGLDEANGSSRASQRALIGDDKSIRLVRQLAQRVSGLDFPVLILGESGTGKELVARSIHLWGPRRDHPFVPVDCPTIVPTLVESELFGYTKGAFTGAQANKQGLLGAAGAGTLFLDEIGDLPLDQQAKLLRAIQEHEFRPVGASNVTRTHARIVAATNRDLQVAVQQKEFRQDLYFRLNVIQITIPPLRERRADIPILVGAFLRRYPNIHDTPNAISAEALNQLVEYDWPGNVRELENVIERAIALSLEPEIKISDLPHELQRKLSAPTQDKHLSMYEVERKAIEQAVEEAGGDICKAARILGIGKTTVYRRLREYRCSSATSEARAASASDKTNSD